MGTDIDITQQSPTATEHDLLSKGLTVRLSSVDDVGGSSASGACDENVTTSEARTSSIEKSRSGIEASCSSSEQHAALWAFHSEAEAVLDTLPSLMVNSLLSKGQEGCPQSQPVSIQRLSVDTGKAGPVHIAAAALKRLFRLQHGCCSTEGCASPP